VEAESRADVDSDRVVEAIVDGGTRVHGRRQPLRRSAHHYLVGAGRKAGYAARRGVAGATGLL
jgi:hypothetical protein